MVMNIHARHEEIVKIVRDETVHSQEELLSILRKRGFRVTQPTLSRDIRDLGLAKTAAGYGRAPVPTLPSRRTKSAASSTSRFSPVEIRFSCRRRATTCGRSNSAAP